MRRVRPRAPRFTFPSAPRVSLLHLRGSRPTLIPEVMKKLLQSRCLKTALVGLGALLTMVGGTAAAASSTLETIRARGHVLCGIGEAQPGFSEATQSGERSGLDVEFCTALAAAVFGSKDAVKFWPLSANDRFKALQSGDVDVVARGAAWTLSRDTEFGARFTGVLFYDGQGFSDAARQCGGERVRAVGRLDLRPSRRDGRAGRLGVLRHAAHALPDRGAGELGRSGQSLCRRQLHRPHRRHLHARRGAQQAQVAGGPHHSARSSSPRSRSGPPCARTTPSGLPWCAGR